LIPKSQLGFGKWTFLKMSKIEKSKDFPKKGVVIALCYHNALKNNVLQKSCDDIFFDKMCLFGA
jgi:hypothetical protein